MGVVIGFALGYVFGTRAGREAYEELKDAVAVIAASDDVRGVFDSVASVVGDVLKAGQGVVGERPNASRLRSIA